METEYKINTLSGRGKDILYKKSQDGVDVKWGDFSFYLDYKIYNEILNKYFVDKDKWYPLGASMTEPISCGLGEFISKYPSLSPRHASAIAAIMVNERHLAYRGKKPIQLQKNDIHKTLSQ